MVQENNQNFNHLLNKILTNACPSQELPGGWNQYIIETHCAKFLIQAKPIKKVLDGNNNYLYSEFDIARSDIIN